MTLAFTSITVNPLGEYKVHDGALFSLPPELSDKFRIQQYLNISNIGWVKSEFDYMALVRIDSAGNKIILPGLYLHDGPRPAKRIYGYTPQFTKAQVEQYLERQLAWEEELRHASEGELTALVHDLRHLSTSIYHSALEAERAARLRKFAEAGEMIKTVIASQTMLRVRIDYLDYSNSVDRFDEIEQIPVYSRVDKVIRCFRADARHKGIGVLLQGESFRLAEGPNILDIVPYTLIENAIKYAPRGTNITVDVIDTDSETEVCIHSLGPALNEGEIDAIFSKGFRGRNAKKIRASGTGLGLSVARKVIDTFRGEITAKQQGAIDMREGLPYLNTTFRFRLPTAGEDSMRKGQAEARKRRRAKRARTIVT